MTAALGASIAGGYLLGKAVAGIMDDGLHPGNLLDLAFGLFATVAGAVYA